MRFWAQREAAADLLEHQWREADRKLPCGQWTVAQMTAADHRQISAALAAGQLRDLGFTAAPSYHGTGCVACDISGRAACIGA